MLYYALLFLVISIVAGLLGFRNIESGAATISKVFFFIFLILAIGVAIMAVLGISLFA
ncbi:Protein of unknown function [Methylophilus rhizosphaerae]|uniref:UPF0391 membrane protein SAMN05192566_1828 n=1 Tax=Methylophilus rhizosphaerae TaxID=492660 RepID=A0A1G9D825_9PROT|nr:DUF1328 domain-containing protein [Methylophilus rhizosphaerae]SDK59884.1 Protein of unknown function [Methylophilus rhizosphaerae]